MRLHVDPLARFLAVVGLIVGVTATTMAGDFHVETRRDIGKMKRKIRAAQFLQRATFGPTIEEIEALSERMAQIGIARACGEWIDQQFELPPSLHEPLIMDMIQDEGYTTTQDLVWIQRFRYHAWWHNALNSEDQLRQRVAWALIQILVTSEGGAGFNDINPGDNSGLGRWLGPTNYYDLMVKHAFGNYRDLLEEVTYHPIMGVYLSHLRNRKTDLVNNRFPDENYAREIMQLFTIGLYELHQDGRLKRDENGELIPTYDNETIKEFAKVFTGLSFKPNPNATGAGRFWWGNDFLYPMEMFNFEHEPGTKTLLNGEVIGTEGGIDGKADISAALDNLMAHDNVAPFIARRLIQRFVKSNPSRAYIRRVARKFRDNGRGVKGDLKAVIKAVLLDPEVWRGQRVRGHSNPNRVTVVTRGTEYSKLAEPMIRYTRLLRGLHAESNYRTGRAMIVPQGWNWTQESYQSPSVFNFWLPDYQPPGDMVTHTPSRRIPNGFLAAPEFQQKTPVTSNRLLNRYIWDINSGKAQHHLVDTNYEMKCDMVFQLDDEMALATEDEDMYELLDLLDLVFCCGSLPQAYKQECVQVVNQETEWMKTNSEWRPQMEFTRVSCAIIGVVTSPYCAVTE